MTTKNGREREEARERLLQCLKPGDTVYCNLKHVSRSGMYRVIDLLVMKNNQPLCISYSASILLEGYDSRWNGCKASGCGMDMGFHLVYNLSYYLFPDGFTPDYDYYQNGHNYKNERVNDGGYALNCRWL